MLAAEAIKVEELQSWPDWASFTDVDLQAVKFRALTSEEVAYF